LSGRWGIKGKSLDHPPALFILLPVRNTNGAKLPGTSIFMNPVYPKCTQLNIQNVRTGQRNYLVFVIS